MGEKIIDLVDEIYECNTREFDYGSKRIPLYLLLGLSFFAFNLFSHKTSEIINKPKLISYSNIEQKNSHSLIPYTIENYLQKKNIENLMHKSEEISINISPERSRVPKYDTQIKNQKIDELKSKFSQIEPEINPSSFYNSANLENIIDSDLVSYLPKDPLAYKTHYLKQQFNSFKTQDKKSKPKKSSSGLKEYDLLE